jgi:hypothetical protein
MSSDRTLYDKGAYLAKTEQSSRPLEWVLDINANENCKVCGEKPNSTKHSDRVSLENELFGLDRKNSKDPKQKYQKSNKIADTLNYQPAWLCERNIKSNQFLVTNINKPNAYMESLRDKSPSDVNKDFDKSKNMCKLTNFLDKNNIDTTNVV